MSVAVPDTDTIEHLDFTPSLPCEHNQHAIHHVPDDPAAWRVLYLCPACPGRKDYLLCESGRRRLMSALIGCRACGATGRWSDFFILCEPLEGK